MKRLSSIFLALILTFPLYSLKIEEILKNPSFFDGKVVKIEAEAIGEPLKGKEGVWINVKGKATIGVFFKDSSWKMIKHFGSYKEKGDILEIEGIFHKNCPQHKIPDIHALRIRIKKEGFFKKEIIPSYKIKVSLFLGIICLTLLGVYFIKDKIWKKKSLS